MARHGGGSVILSGSAQLADTLDWQSVLVLGYGDDRTFAVDGGLDRVSRHLFLTVSCAIQR